MHYDAGVQDVKMMSGTYIQGTIGQWCILLKQCLNLLPGHCGAGVKAV